MGVGCGSVRQNGPGGLGGETEISIGEMAGKRKSLWSTGRPSGIGGGDSLTLRVALKRTICFGVSSFAAGFESSSSLLCCSTSSSFLTVSPSLLYILKSEILFALCALFVMTVAATYSLYWSTRWLFVMGSKSLILSARSAFIVSD